MAKEMPSYVVCLGASAGGLEAITSLVSTLGTDFPAAIVVAQHLSPTHRSLLAPLVERATDLEVVELARSKKLRAGVVYIVPENKDALVTKDSVKLVKSSSSRGPHPSVNRLFESLSHAWGNRGIGVVLSGTGSDGADGASAIDDAGGTVFAQDEDSAKYWSMPKAVIDRGVARTIQPPEVIARTLTDFVSGRREVQPTPEDVEAAAFRNIADAVESVLDFGIMNYKSPTVLRRISARMAARQCNTIEDYKSVLQDDVSETSNLVDALLIPVTTFFRDREAFDVLAKHIGPRLDECIQDERPFRAWVTGCCTGEEAYSIAMIVEELLVKKQARLPVQIFATDLSEAFIDQARRGFYSSDKVVDVPQHYLERYFQEVANGYRVIEELRERLVFARHDIIRSTPFMHLDLISCRNLLIYLKQSAQANALATIAGSLDAGGTLFLGRSETVGELTEAFQPLSSKHRIYQRSEYKAGAQRLRGANAILEQSAVRRRALRRAEKKASLNPEERMREFLLHNGMPTILIDAADNILHVAGDTTDAMRISPGPFSKGIYALVPEAVGIDLRTTILAARRTGKATRSRIVHIGEDDARTAYRFVAHPVDGEDHPEELFVAFERQANGSRGYSKATDADVLAANVETATEDMRQELLETRQHLRTVIEELEISNEELQAANEELMSSNEEFQATNEELETTNEELQATNEELETVNDELLTKNREISALHLDLSNLFSSFDDPLFVFGGDQLLRSMNRAAETLVERHADGQDVSNMLALSSVLGSGELYSAMCGSTTKGSRHEKLEIAVGSRRYQGAVSRYEEARSGQASTVVYLQDITEIIEVRDRLQKQQDELTDLEARERAIIDGIQGQVALIEPDGRISTVNKAWMDFAKANGYQHQGFGVGENYIEICEQAHGDCAEEAKLVAERLQAVLSSETEDSAIEYPCHSPTEKRWFRCVIHGVESRGRRAAVVMHVDVTQHKLLHEKLQQACLNAEDLSVAKSSFLANMSHELRTPLTAIIGFTDTIETETFGPIGNDRYREYMTDIAESAQHLLGIISEIIEFSRAENQMQTSEKRAFVFEDAVRFAVKTVESAYKQKHIHFRVKQPTDPQQLIGDERLIRQVLINIMSNAAKASPNDGLIEVDCAKRKHGLELAITDHGPGVDPNVLPRIFEPFEQGRRDVYETPNRGLGLGLSIVKSIIDRHGGTISARNVKPHGLKIALRFPAEEVAQRRAVN